MVVCEGNALEKLMGLYAACLIAQTSLRWHTLVSSISCVAFLGLKTLRAVIPETLQRFCQVDLSSDELRSTADSIPQKPNRGDK